MGTRLPGQTPVGGGICALLSAPSRRGFGAPGGLHASLAQINVKSAPHGGYESSHGGWEVERG